MFESSKMIIRINSKRNNINNYIKNHIKSTINFLKSLYPRKYVQFYRLVEKEKQK